VARGPHCMILASSGPVQDIDILDERFGCPGMHVKSSMPTQ